MTETLTADRLSGRTRSATWSIAPTRWAACQKNAIEQHFGRKADFEVVSDGVLVVEANNRGEPFVKAGA